MAQKYGWFSPVKGAYPSMHQEDKTAELVSTDVEDVCRGTVLKLNDDGQFEVATSFTTGDDLYFCLQDGTDTQAEFAGGTWYGDTPYFKGPYQRGETTIPVPKVLRATGDGDPTGVFTRTTGPAVTGVSVYQSGEYQTSVFAAGSYAVGDKLTVNSKGELQVAASGAYFAIVTKAPTSRYLNDKPMPSGRNQGMMGDVLQFRTVA